MHRLTLIALAAFALSDPALARDPAGAVFFNDVSVFDGEAAVGVRDVLLRDGRIAEMAADLQAPSDAEIVEGRGLTLLPGLMDAHVHYFPTASADALRFGVTTEFDMFGFLEPVAVAARRAQRAGLERVDEADVWSAGRGVTLAGAHPTGLARRMGVELPTLAEDADAAAFIEAEVAEGSDYIKIFQDAAVVNGQARFPEYSRAKLGEIIDAAHAAGVKAIVHVSTDADARDVFALGGDAIAHMFEDEPARPETVALAAEHGSVIIATLAVLAGASGEDASARLAADPNIAPHLSPVQSGMLAQAFPTARPEVLVNALESVRRFHAAGVTILAGTDAPNPGTAHGPSIHEELELLVRGGLSPADALAAATSRPATFFGTEDRGRIAAGLRADVVLVRGDPLTDIAATRDIVGVWKNGFPIDRARMPVMPTAGAAQ